MLTKKEKEMVLKAAEIVDSQEQEFSCIAIVAAGLNQSNNLHTILLVGSLLKKYEKFYNNGISTRFVSKVIAAAKEAGISKRDLRVMMLLTFAEVG